mmetsp:Transcript_27797/g.50767  ORF Transcript_27797/g.50767 Transcript_27797/m.50767 type:complete len:426 (-) Transcript_27797:24-1301(-)
MFLARRGEGTGPHFGYPSTAAELLVLENLHELTSRVGDTSGRQPQLPYHSQPRPPTRPRSAGPTPNYRRLSRGTAPHVGVYAPRCSDADGRRASQPLQPGGRRKTDPAHAIRTQSAPSGRRLSGSARKSLRERIHTFTTLEDGVDELDETGTPLPCPFSPATKRRYHLSHASPEQAAHAGQNIGGLTARAAPWLFSVPTPLDDPRWYRSAEAQVMGLNYFNGMIKLVDLYSSKVATDTFMRSEASKAAASRDTKAKGKTAASEKQEGSPTATLEEALVNAKNAAAAQTLRPRRHTRTEGVIFVNGVEVRGADEDTDEEEEEAGDSWMEQRLWTGKSLEALDELRHATVGTDVLRLESAFRRAQAEHIERLGPDGQELLAAAELRLRQLWPFFDAPGDAAQGWLARSRTGSKLEPDAGLQRTRSSR